MTISIGGAVYVVRSERQLLDLLARLTAAA